MDNFTKTRLVNLVNLEYVRRLLIKYFSDKGYKNFKLSPYPPSLTDLTESIPQLRPIIEIKNFVEDIDMVNSNIKMGWNLFILGNKRVFLGYTTHKNLSDVNNAKYSVDFYSGPISIEEIINNVINLLRNYEHLSDISSRKIGDGQLGMFHGNMSKARAFDAIS